MPRYTHATVLAAIACVVTCAQAVADADPFWIVQHGPAVVTSRLDPLISPGEVSGHVHSVVGSSAFSSNYDYDKSRAGKCTTANVGDDMSNYWIPQLYRKQDNGTFEIVKMNRVNTYYFMRRSGPDEEVHEFPSGFRMLAGNAKRTTYDADDYTNAAINYVCLGIDGSPATPAFPEQSCPQDLRAQVFFPNCWDGKNEWLEGSAHVAYPVSGGHEGGGPCPSTHPKRIMSLFYEFHFADQYDYKPGARVWANGDNVGYTLHGDFTTGWPLGLFPEIFEYGATCNVMFELGTCPPLAKTFAGVGGETCAPDDKSVLVNEDIGETGSLAKLPGENPIWGADGPASNTAATSTKTAAATGGAASSTAQATDTAITTNDNEPAPTTASTGSSLSHSRSRTRTGSTRTDDAVIANAVV
ncbi:hypothetical protein IAT38_003700 [Cryptococcus sp. DSM 104549]